MMRHVIPLGGQELTESWESYDKANYNAMKNNMNVNPSLLSSTSQTFKVYLPSIIKTLEVLVLQPRKAMSIRNES